MKINFYYHSLQIVVILESLGIQEENGTKVKLFFKIEFYIHYPGGLIITANTLFLFDLNL